MQAKHYYLSKELKYLKKKGYFGVFQRFMYQHSEMQAKHIICLKN
ncbi:hypothetical protein E2C01_101466 [Portunus trituberculatus]|uniref:Uncharacterized protein n=1 Tax=Portunus trituberculatus TaxID=210409 RepID=A0A5B7KFS6_PORTR|nr:hypothetical protein [Portunus trituberculatus]